MIAEDELTPLRDADRQGAVRQPLPPLPHRRPRRARGGDGQERQRQRVDRGADEHRREERADQAEERDRDPGPADREDRGRCARDERPHDRELRRDERVDVRRDEQRHEQAARGNTDEHDRCLGPATPRMEPGAESEERERAEARERRPCLRPNPSTCHGQREEQDDSEQRRDAADPGEHPPADEVAERDWLTAAFTRGRGRGCGGDRRRVDDRQRWWDGRRRAGQARNVWPAPPSRGVTTASTELHPPLQFGETRFQLVR